MKILIRERAEETQAAVVDGGRLIDFIAERTDREDLVGRIYKGVVKNVVPAVKGRFLDIGIEKNAFLRDEDLPAGARPTEGMTLLVQVVKDSTATKGPLVTGKVSLPGRYSVLLTDTSYIGISKKIRSEEKRERLRHAARNFCAEPLGCIVRTAADTAEESAVEEDLRRLSRCWETISRRARIEKAPALLYREQDLVLRILRDFMTEETDEIVTDDAALAERLEGFAGDKKITLVRGRLFKEYGVAEAIDALFDREVPLASGGSIVIEETEALTAVDVNSGSFRQKGIPHGELAYLTNREAAVEIARQIRMRGIGGMIVIDFIDMDKDEQKDAVVALLRRETARDRVKTVVLGMTQLGLVEMTRKRTAHRLTQNYYDACPLCGGAGRVLSPASVVLRIHYALEEEKQRGGGGPLLISCHPDVAALLETPEEHFFLASLMLRPIRIERHENPHREVFSILADRETL